ncbi:MAG: hypothetical protein Q7T20_14055 [Saprospiraceae bacterium]|nr:hypothetical protein [Saprospiraceae bacterium]
MGFFSKLFGQKTVSNPGDKFITTVTDKYVRVEHPTRKPEEIQWKNIKEIRLVNTDKGPFAPDIWLILIGENDGCSIPHGNKGYEQVYDIVSKYDSFDFENVIKSMSSINNEQFLLWTRK